MNYYAGIDSGSTTTEIVVLDDDGRIVSYHRTLTKGDIQTAVGAVFNKALDELGCSENDLAFVVGTGYGRKSIPYAHKAVTEITCYAVGANHLDPEVRTVIDIGGQDSKVSLIDERGSVLNFVMNDKCAAGTGKFLEMLANTFDTNVDELGGLASKSANNLKISSVCAVFAESEMISLFAKGYAKEDIIHAAHRAVCDRVIGMSNRIGLKEQVMLCGGVARNSGIVKCFEESLGVPVVLPDNVDNVGALGAALIAKRRHNSK